jgi:hypothetical protein
MDSNMYPGDAKWRLATAADLVDIQRLGDEIHVDLPERPEAFAEKFHLFPEGCFVLEQNKRRRRLVWAKSFGTPRRHQYRAAAV